MQHFSGSYVALVTPWNKDLSNVDYGALKELIDWHMECGTDGILPAGTTGESATLTPQEHKELVAKTVELVAGRAKVLAGAGSNSTNEAVALAKHAKASGADSILVITPYYNRPTPEGLYQHYGTVAEACDLPVMIYNVPSRTGTNILPETIIRINKSFPTVIGVKEASGSVDQSAQIINGCAMDVMSGDDSLALPIMAVGGTGVVSVIANIAPAETKQFMDAALAGDYVKAREWHHKLLPIMKACFVETNPAPAKTALEIMGRISGRMRLPMVELKPESRTVLEAALRKVGLVK
ncbi:MAG: 4-hydroxy-tetrahydrodipicolinate synthase [Planctomycetaceae bacterium]|nr:4-hydroxy-tetrahydrodipicolinate synthase [Planctomycetaceae bacterium]